MKTLAVIPARYSSTRLPGKPLIHIAGVPLVIRVLNSVSACASVDRVVVATDDERIARLVEAHGGEAVMTPAELPSGGDRVAFVARMIPSDYVLNVQVDDPLVAADMIDPLVEALDADPSVKLALLAKRIEKMEELEAKDVVKVVFDAKRRALYFSRSPIPYPRNDGGVWYKHIGPYGWRRGFLLDFAASEQTPLEKTESLEMLRVIENGYAIKCVAAMRDTIEIDTPDDLLKIEKYFSGL
ncbi:MAG: 3-deoxy-manno-octulosonate cytidylyltransferase [Synergistaceae bacterium]|nr:3-deoxy-manno-octulosonate cytidylyltransferase [Synergistaceae bacterium]